MCRSRTVFLTDSGHLGLGPQCFQSGDSICFLMGAAVPLLLRSQAGPDSTNCRWMLVGETYVHGLAGALPDHHFADNREGSRLPKFDEKTRALLVIPKTEQGPFLHVQEEERAQRSYYMMSNDVQASLNEEISDRWGFARYKAFVELEGALAVPTATFGECVQFLIF